MPEASAFMRPFPGGRFSDRFIAKGDLNGEWRDSSQAGHAPTAGPWRRGGIREAASRDDQQSDMGGLAHRLRIRIANAVVLRSRQGSAFVRSWRRPYTVVPRMQSCDIRDREAHSVYKISRGE